MNCTLKIIGLISLFMGIGILVGIIIPCNSFVLALILVGIGLATVLN